MAQCPPHKYAPGDELVTFYHSTKLFPADLNQKCMITKWSKTVIYAYITR